MAILFLYKYSIQHTFWSIISFSSFRPLLSFTSFLFCLLFAFSSYEILKLDRYLMVTSDSISDKIFSHLIQNPLLCPSFFHHLQSLHTIATMHSKIQRGQRRGFRIANSPPCESSFQYLFDKRSKQCFLSWGCTPPP